MLNFRVFKICFAGKASYKKKKLIAFLPHYFIVLTLYFYDLFLKLIFEKGERKRDRERGGEGRENVQVHNRQLRTNLMESNWDLMKEPRESF